MGNRYVSFTEIIVSVILVTMFAVGYTSAHNKVVVVPLGGDDGTTVLPGMVIAFNLVDCPSGWQENTPSRGRMVIGLNPGGRLGGLGGNPYSDLEVREHNHTWAVFDADEKSWREAISNDVIINWGDGMDSDGSGFYPLGVSDSVTTDLALKTNTAKDDIPYVQYLMCQKD